MRPHGPVLQPLVRAPLQLRGGRGGGPGALEEGPVPGLDARAHARPADGGPDEGQEAGGWRVVGEDLRMALHGVRDAGAAAAGAGRGAAGDERQGPGGGHGEDGLRGKGLRDKGLRDEAAADHC